MRAPQGRARSVAVLASDVDRADGLARAILRAGLADEASGGTAAADGGSPPDVLLLDLRHGEPASDAVPSPAAGAVCVVVDERPLPVARRVAGWHVHAVVAASPDAGNDAVAELLALALPAPVGDIARFLSGFGVDPDADGDTDDHTLRRTLRELVAGVGLRGLSVLRASEAAGTRLSVVASSGDVPAVGERMAWVLDGASVGGAPPLVVPAVQVDGHPGQLEGPWLVLGADGRHLDVVAARVPVGWARCDLVQLLGPACRMLDRKLGRARMEADLRERVRELESLRRVQLAIQQRVQLPSLVPELAGSLLDGIGRRDSVAVTVEIDGIVATAGAAGVDELRASEPVLVDGVERGFARVETTTLHPPLVSEERELLRSVTEAVAADISRREAQQRLVATERRQARILSSLPSVVFTIAPDGMLELISRGETVPPRLGALGKPFPLDAWNDPIAERLRAWSVRAFAGERTREPVEWRGRWWDLRLEPIRDGADVVTEVLGLAVDITLVRHARQLEAQLASIVETAHVGIASVTLDGTIETWNDGAARIFGWSADEIVGRPVGALDPLDPRAVTTVVTTEEVLEGGATVRYLETKRRHRQGHDVDVGVSLTPVTGPDGALLGASAIYLDLSERRAVERGLAASEEELRLLADHAQDVIYRLRLEPEPLLEFISRSCETVLGFPAERYIQEPGLVMERVHPDDRDAVADAHADLRRGGTVTVRFLHSDGRYRWIQDRRSPLVVDGEVIGVLGIARDVTEERASAEATSRALERERRALEQLRNLDAMKSAFLSAVSHELRTPLTSVIGFAETTHRLATGAVESRELVPFLDRLVRNAHRLDRLVTDLLDVDRLTRGEILPRYERVDLVPLVERAIQRYDGGTRTIDADLVRTSADIDPMMIDRCVDNLIRNATRHTPPDATIWVRLRAQGDTAVVIVEDDGPGVPEELWLRVFEPFQQGPSASSSASPGTGIGLSLVDRFVRAHGGQVQLDERPGGGARFTVRLARSRRGDPIAGSTVVRPRGDMPE